MRKTLRPTSRTRRPRKRIRLGALTAPSSTIQRSSPLLVTAEIRPRPARLWDPDRGRPAPGRVAEAAHVVRAQPGLVAPEDDPAFGLGPRQDHRVVPPEPAPHHRYRVLLV